MVYHWFEDYYDRKNLIVFGRQLTKRGCDLLAGPRILTAANFQKTHYVTHQGPMKAEELGLNLFYDYVYEDWQKYCDHDPQVELVMVYLNERKYLDQSANDYIYEALKLYREVGYRNLKFISIFQQAVGYFCVPDSSGF